MWENDIDSMNARYKQAHAGADYADYPTIKANIAAHRNTLDKGIKLADAYTNQVMFAGIGAPIAIASAAALGPAMIGGGGAELVNGLYAADQGQAHLRGLLNGSFKSQGTLGGSAISELTDGRFGEGAYALGALGATGLYGTFTNAEGFLGGGLKIKAPFNIPVQRLGTVADGRVQPWGLRIGSSKLANRTLAAITPEFNPSLDDQTLGIIPKGSPLKFGIIGPQSPIYPGGSLQFNIDSAFVTDKIAKKISR